MKTLENIKNNLLHKAAVKFQSHQSGLDREKKLFLHWMAYELYGLHKELENSKDYIEKNITQRLTPEVATRPIPVHAIAQATPKKNGYIVKPSEDVFTIDRFGNQAPYEIYFSPLKPTQLVGAKVRWLGQEQSLIEISEGNISQEKARTADIKAFHPGIKWLGIELQKDTVLPKKLCFHFSLATDDQSEQLQDLQALVQWFYQDQKIESSPQMNAMFKKETGTKIKHPDNEFFHLHAFEKKVLAACQGQFITIENEFGFEPGTLPNEIKNNFEAEDLEKIDQGNLIWLKLVFPSGYTPENIYQMKVRLNCFPIVNRKMDKSKDFTPAHHDLIEICALSNGDNRREELGNTRDFFFGIEGISSKKINYRATTFESFNQVPPGYYALQHGRVEANDFRDVLTRTSELIQLIQTHHTRIKQVSSHSIQNAMQQLENGTQELEQALEHTPATSQDPGYYLHLKAADPQDMIYVRFWVTQGKEAAGVLSKGDLLVSERSGLPGEGIWVV